MKLENLKIGQVVKNYAELCTILEIKKCAGKSKQLQMQKIEEYISYEKDKNKFIIKGIKKLKMREEITMDKRVLGNNNEQAKYIRYILLNVLSAHNLSKDEIVGYSKGLLLRKLHMLNDNYIIAKTKRSEYANALNIEQIAIDECIEYIDDRSIKAVKKSINTLINMRLIGYKYSYSYVDKTKKNHTCNTIEHNAIMECEYRIMKSMNIKSKSKIWEYKRWNEFKRRVKELLIEDYSMLFKDIDYYYSSFHFHYNKEHIQEYMRYMEVNQEITYEIAINNIDKIWSKSLDTTIYNNQRKAKLDQAPKKCSKETIEYRKKEDYKEEQKKIKETMINKEYELINVKKIKETKQIDIETHLNQIEIPF